MEKKEDRRDFLKKGAGLLGMIFAGIRPSEGKPNKLAENKNNEEYYRSENFRKVLSKLKENNDFNKYNKENNFNYPVPVEGVRTFKHEANFSIFPEKLNFVPGRKILIISDFWQTACLYDEEGYIQRIEDSDSKEMLPIMFQVGTGKSSYPTEFGLHEILEKMDENYVSSTYPKRETPEKSGGGKMSFALKLGKFLGISKQNEMSFDNYDGTAVHGRDSVNEDFTKVRNSHGCIGVNLYLAEFLNKYLTGKNDAGKGDFVLVIDDIVDILGNMNELQTTVKGLEKKRKRMIEEKYKYVPTFNISN